MARSTGVLATSPVYGGGSTALREVEDKVRVLPLGIDLTPFCRPNAAATRYARQFRKAMGDQPLWLAVGRLVYYKGFEVALKALAQVPGRLVVVGSGPLDRRLRVLAERLRVADRVLWKSNVDSDELVGLYHAATAFWMSSNTRSEGFGLVQVEAMASGCPVLNADIAHSGVPWVAQHEKSALTVPPNDPIAFAAAANRILEEPGLRERLARNAKQRALDEFSEPLMGVRSLSVYAELCRKTAPKTADAAERLVANAGRKDGCDDRSPILAAAEQM
jgi:rhamnosyl/mannosyltransferase